MREDMYEVAADPFVLEEMAWKPEPTVVLPDLDFQEAGIYDSETIRRLDLFSQAPRAGQGLAASLAAQQLASDLAADQVRATNLFPDLRPFSNVLSHPALDFFNWLWNIVQHYGRICSVIVGTAILWKFITWIGGVLLRLCMRPRGNCVMHILGALCPDLTNTLNRPRGCCAPLFRHKWFQCCLPYDVYNHDDHVEVRSYRAYHAPGDDENENDDTVSIRSKEERQRRLVKLYARQTADRVADHLKDNSHIELLPVDQVRPDAAGVYPKVPTAPPAKVQL